MFRATLSVLVLVGLALGTTVDARADYLDSDIVQAHSSNYYTTTRNNSGTIGIAVVGDGDTDIDIIVTDEFGNVVASNLNYTDTCAVEFYGRSGMNYSIEVRNLGSVWNQYSFALVD